MSLVPLLDAVIEMPSDGVGTITCSSQMTHKTHFKSAVRLIFLYSSTLRGPSKPYLRNVNIINIGTSYF
jgi:hypothetical protein